MDYQTQVIKFFNGQTKTGKQKWDVYFADGSKATAWEYAVAAKAEQAWKSGATVVVSIEEKPSQNGAPFRNLTAVTEAQGVTQSQAAQNPQPALGGRQNGSGGFSGGMSAEDKIRVTKLSCISSAAAIFSGSGDVEATLKAAAEIFTAVWAPEKPAQPVVAQEPQAVQQFVNGNAGAPVVQVGVAEEKPAAALPWAVA